MNDFGYGGLIRPSPISIYGIKNYIDWDKRTVTLDDIARLSKYDTVSVLGRLETSFLFDFMESYDNNEYWEYWEDYYCPNNKPLLAREEYCIVKKSLSFRTHKAKKEACKKVNDYVRKENLFMHENERPVYGSVRESKHTKKDLFGDYLSNKYYHMEGVLTHRVRTLLFNAEKTAFSTIQAKYCREYIMDPEVSRIFSKKFVKNVDKFHHLHTRKVPNGEYEYSNIEFACVYKKTVIYCQYGNTIDDGEQHNQYDLRMLIFGKNKDFVCKIVDFLFAKTTGEINHNNDMGVYTVNSSKENNLNIEYNSLPKRDIDTLFYSNGEKEKIISHLDNYISKKDFYEKKQILYKTGILLFGSPGTGKTTIVKALAHKYNRQILQLNMATIDTMDLNTLTTCINNDNNKFIVLMEDIDTLFLNRSDEFKKVDREVVNKLLQFLDSNNSPKDVIFIATTNHVQNLDEALIREGRFDLKVEIAPLKEKEVIAFGKSFDLTDTEIEESIKTAVEEYNKKHEDKRTEDTMEYVQAKMQSIFLKYLGLRSSDELDPELISEMEEEVKELTEEPEKKPTKSRSRKKAKSE